MYSPCRQTAGPADKWEIKPHACIFFTDQCFVIITLSSLGYFFEKQQHPPLLPPRRTSCRRRTCCHRRTSCRSPVRRDQKRPKCVLATVFWNSCACMVCSACVSHRYNRSTCILGKIAKSGRMGASDFKFNTKMHIHNLQSDQCRALAWSVGVQRTCFSSSSASHISLPSPCSPSCHHRTSCRHRTSCPPVCEEAGEAKCMC